MPMVGIYKKEKAIVSESCAHCHSQFKRKKRGVSKRRMMAGMRPARERRRGGEGPNLSLQNALCE
ncbi:hypothetical protein LIA77_01849 [Sarocladium implicatum]|nr:hypothetical protein LIA77_01849 [Sarocladium implicatum]